MTLAEIEALVCETRSRVAASRMQITRTADFKDRQTHQTLKKLAADYERLASVQEMLAHAMDD